MCTQQHKNYMHKITVFSNTTKLVVVENFFLEKPASSVPTQYGLTRLYECRI